ncbi:hypothetical protein ACFVMC_28550 [Nocardia sp. NPDC127579]|uniref:hypothetical protein n=1 Tax=Nocardia sp. NPDC127579 TaxID=3345402 RepID=UPI0036282B1D
MRGDNLDQWLGAKWKDIPVRHRADTIEYVFGADLTTISSYAASKARYLLANLDPDTRTDFEDIAQDTVADLITTLPTARVTHWRTFVLHRVDWHIRQRRRHRLTAKRHPGVRIDFDTAAPAIESVPDPDNESHWVNRDLLQAALDAIADADLAAVLRATFILASDGSYADICTTDEVAHDLGYSRSKVKRLRARGIRELREYLDSARDHTESR